MKLFDVLVIGSGLSGLSCAQELVKNGLSVLVLDKGFLPGGRTASKTVITPIGNATFDYGAQYFTVESIDFLKQVNEWVKLGVAEKWAQWFESTMPNHREHKLRYKANPTMRQICLTLANGLEIKQKTKIIRLNGISEGWEIIDENNESYFGKNLVITSPITQSLNLCYISGVIPDYDTIQFISQQKYHTCITLMIATDLPSSVPEPGGLWCDPSTGFQWIADNKIKGISEVSAITAHLSLDASKNYFDLSDEAIFAQVKPFLARYLNGDWVYSKIHRWKYAQPVNIVETTFIQDKYYQNLWFSGDVFLNGRVESAWISGFKTAKAILKSL